MKSLSQLPGKDVTTAITPPVLFFCHVSGEPLTAYFNGIVDHPLFYSFSIKFSNGFEDNFTLLENGLVEGDKKSIAAAYAMAIKDDLQVLVHFSADKEVYTLRWQINSKQSNVWVIEAATTGERMYKVCYNSNLRFQIKKAGAGWLATPLNDANAIPVDTKLVAEIGRMIDRERGHG
jgi:hypothetical protein